jgi:hypothetical protein
VKKFIYSIIALLGVFLFFACEPVTSPGGTDTQYFEIDYDAGSKAESTLKDVLRTDNPVKLIAIVSDINLKSDLKIPSGKTVRLLAGSLTTGAHTLTVEGLLDVKSGQTLTVSEAVTSLSAGAGSLVVTGKVDVQKGGTLWLPGVGSAVAKAEDTSTVLGTAGKVAVSGGNLKIKEVEIEETEGADPLKSLKSAFGSVQSGLLTVIETVKIKPSDVAGIGTSASRKLKITVEGEEDAETLNIPVGLDLTVTSDLESITGDITVNGDLTVSTLSVDDNECTLTVNGSLTVTTALLIPEETFIKGEGVISTGGAGTISFLDWSEDDEDYVGINCTAPGGVNVAEVLGVKKDLKASVKMLTNTPQINLWETFAKTDESSSPEEDDEQKYYGIGSVTITAKDKATEIQNTADGKDRNPIALKSGTLLYGATVKGTEASSDGGEGSGGTTTDSTFTLSFSSGKLVVTDSGWAESGTETPLIVEFSGVQLIYQGLVFQGVVNGDGDGDEDEDAEEGISFRIGVITKRSSSP